MGTEIEFCLKHNSRPAAGSGENEDKKTGQVYLEVYCNCSAGFMQALTNFLLGKINVTV